MHGMSLCLSFLVVPIFVATTAAPLESLSSPATLRSPPLVGAIRWDVWVGDLVRTPNPNFQLGLFNEETISPPQWHYRVPFYGKELNTTSIQARFDTQAVMDAEIDSAAGALDYWVFLDYPAWQEGTGNMHTALRLYLSSSKKSKVGFAIMTDAGKMQGHTDTYLGYLRERSYQTVLSTRPLVYIFARGAIDAEIETLGLQYAKLLGNLTAASRAQGTGEPYYVAMHNNPILAARLSDLGGMHAVTTYAYHHSSPALVAENAHLPYANLTHDVAHRWNDYRRATHGDLIPFIMAGWDGRPRLEDPLMSKWATNAGYNISYETGTPAEVAAHVVAGLEYARHHARNTTANTVLAYAWNEFGEGGWLCPLLHGGDARLRAIQRARKVPGAPTPPPSPP